MGPSGGSWALPGRLQLLQGPCLDVFGLSWAVSKLSWAVLTPSWAAWSFSQALLGASWASLGPRLRSLGPIPRPFGRPRNVVFLLGDVLGESLGHFEPSWGRLEASCTHAGGQKERSLAILRDLGSHREPLGPLLAGPGALLERMSPQGPFAGPLPPNRPDSASGGKGLGGAVISHAEDPPRGRRILRGAFTSGLCNEKSSQ